MKLHNSPEVVGGVALTEIPFVYLLFILVMPNKRVQFIIFYDMETDISTKDVPFYVRNKLMNDSIIQKHKDTAEGQGKGTRKE